MPAPEFDQYEEYGDNPPEIAPPPPEFEIAEERLPPPPERQTCDEMPQNGVRKRARECRRRREMGGGRGAVVRFTAIAVSAATVVTAAAASGGTFLPGLGALARSAFERAAAMPVAAPAPGIDAASAISAWVGGGSVPEAPAALSVQAPVSSVPEAQEAAVKPDASPPKPASSDALPSRPDARSKAPAVTAAAVPAPSPAPAPDPDVTPPAPETPGVTTILEPEREPEPAGEPSLTPPTPESPAAPAPAPQATPPSRPSHGGGSSSSHTHTWDAGEVTREATCGADGERTYRCSENASHTKTEAIPATGAHVWDAGTETAAAGCLTAGETRYTCTVCGQSKTDQTAALGHDFSGPWQSDAMNHWRGCVRNDARSELEAHASADGAWTSDGTAHWYVCDVCGLAFASAVHEWGPWSERAEVTGHVRSCDFCGQEETALHNYTYTDNGDGTHAKACAVGGESAAALPHDWSGGDACACGAVRPAPTPEAGFTYSGSGLVFDVRWAPQPGVEIDETKPVRAFISFPYDDTNAAIVVNLARGADGVWTTDTTATVAKPAAGSYTATFLRVYQDSPTDASASLEEVNQTLIFTYAP